MFSAPKLNSPFLSKRYTLKFCTQVHVHPETCPPRGHSFFPLNYLVVRIVRTYTCINVSKKSAES